MSLEKYFNSEAEMLEYLQETADHDRVTGVDPISKSDLEQMRVSLMSACVEAKRIRRQKQVSVFIPRKRVAGLSNGITKRFFTSKRKAY
jgi:hypothetical protein